MYLAYRLRRCNLRRNFHFAIFAKRNYTPLENMVSYDKVHKTLSLSYYLSGWSEESWPRRKKRRDVKKLNRAQTHSPTLGIRQRKPYLSYSHDNHLIYQSLCVCCLYVCVCCNTVNLYWCQILFVYRVLLFTCCVFGCFIYCSGIENGDSPICYCL